MPWNYREDRTAQAAARLLYKRGGRMSYMKLLKLLYFADRRALAELGRPITFDRYVSMPHGPVLSRTLDVITSEPDPAASSYWASLISARDLYYDVRLLGATPCDQLSPAEEQILDQVFAEFGHLGRYEIRDYTHTLAEWQDPHGSSVPIDVLSILKAQGVSEEDAKSIVEALSASSDLEQHVG